MNERTAFQYLNDMVGRVLEFRAAKNASDLAPQNTAATERKDHAWGEIIDLTMEFWNDRERLEREEKVNG